jgi:hypothetical protein
MPVNYLGPLALTSLQMRSQSSARFWTAVLLHRFGDETSPVRKAAQDCRRPRLLTRQTAAARRSKLFSSVVLSGQGEIS